MGGGAKGATENVNSFMTFHIWMASLLGLNHIFQLQIISIFLVILVIMVIVLIMLIMVIVLIVVIAVIMVSLIIN